MKVAENIKGKLNQRCHLNSFKHKKETNSDIYIGYYVEVFRDNITAIPHFFNVLNNTIIDTSLGSKNGMYFGKKVTSVYPSSNKMFDVELWQTLYLEQRIETIIDLEKINTKYNLIKLN